MNVGKFYYFPIIFFFLSFIISLCEGGDTSDARSTMKVVVKISEGGIFSWTLVKVDSTGKEGFSLGTAL